MPRIKFNMDDIAVSVTAGEKMLDVCEEVGSSIPFGCTNGVCGTCITKVSSQEALGEMKPREKQTLEMFGALDGEHRLICQCVTTHKDVELDNP